MEHNMRLINNDNRVDSTWTATTADRVTWSLRLLADYQTSEPNSEWRLQTRGEFRDWHDWEAETYAT